MLASELTLDNGIVPTRINILPPSGFAGRDGRGPFTYDFTALSTAFTANGMPIALDYDHQSETAAEKSGPVPASGWINTLEYDPPTGTWANVEWTEDAASHIADKAYRGFSPVFSVDTSNNQILEIIGGGLTNRPNLHLVMLNSRDGGYTRNEQSPEHTKMLEKLLAALGLSASAAEDAALSALQSLQSLADKATAIDAAAVAAGFAAAATTPAEIVQSLNARTQITTGGYVAKNDFEVMSKRATDAETALQAMKKTTADAELNSILEAAKVAGKLTPAQLAHAKSFGEKDPAGLKAFIDASAPVVSTKPADFNTQVSTHTKTLTEQQKRQAFLRGQSEAEFANALQSN